MTDRERLVELLKKAPLCDKAFDLQYSDGTIEKIADYLLENGVIIPPCKVGDYVEWDNGIGKNKRLHQIKGFYYEPENGLRYDLGLVCPVITHQAITRIVPREEAEKALRDNVPDTNVGKKGGESDA